MRYIGIDPGKAGAIAALDDTGDIVSAEDMPVVDGKVSEVVVAAVLRRLTTDTSLPGIIAIEVVHSMPGEGSTSSFSFGAAAGIVRGAAATIASGAPERWRLARPQPAEWKRHHHLVGKDKDASRLLALDLWPHHADLFKNKKDHGRAEAALIALWAKETAR
jgi:hypothetical protein